MNDVSRSSQTSQDINNEKQSGHSAENARGVTTVEWNVLNLGEPYLQPWTENEEEARSYSNCVTGPLVSRTRTRYPDHVSKPRVISPTEGRP